MFPSILNNKMNKILKIKISLNLNNNSTIEKMNNYKMIIKKLIKIYYYNNKKKKFKNILKSKTD